jgi:hypothetical protein
MKTILLLIFVFIAGVFFGIWLNWKHKTGPRQIVYQVQDYQRANVEVFPGDTISLVNPGGESTGLQMNFVGDLTPCKGKQNHSATCVIDKGAAQGPYFFTCSGGGYSCPDPGMQQSPTGPLEDTYADAVETDLFGVQSAPQESQSKAPTATPQPAASAVTAVVACDTTNNITEVLDLSGNPLNPIPATSGESVFWISTVPFSLDTSKFPANFCSNGNPSGTNLTQARCDIPQSYTGHVTLTYTVQSQTTPTACPALTTAQLKVN